MRTYASSRVKWKSFYIFCWFPAAILVHQNGAPIWRLHTKLYKGAWNVSANNSEPVGHKDLRLRKIVDILVFYNISFSWLLPLDGFQFNFLLSDRENDLLALIGEGLDDRTGHSSPCERNFGGHETSTSSPLFTLHVELTWEITGKRSLSALRRLKLWTRSSMTEERLSGLAMMLIHRGTNYMPMPKDVYERKSNWRHLLQVS